MSAKPNSGKNLANIAGLVSVNTEEAIRPIARDILHTMHRNAVKRASELNKNGGKVAGATEAEYRTLAGKIEKVYSEWNDNYPYQDDDDAIQSTALFGPPGHGKTTAFKVASKRVADALGMRYLENGAMDAIENIGINDFVFVTQETSGVISALEWLGLPTGEVIPNDHAGTSLETKRMGRLYSGALLKLQDAGGGCLLLDDFLNASPAIQGVGLSLTLEKRFNRLNLDCAYIGVTGNLGALDGTHTNRPSTALRNRLKTYFTEDTLENWSNRVQRKYNDELGDAGVLGFLQRFPDKFSQEANVKESGGYATPRSLEALVVEVRRILRDHGGRQNMANALGEIGRACQSGVGLTTGGEMMTYYHSLAASADPLARQVILGGKLDKETLESKFKSGFAAAEQHFGFQYVTALADYTVVKVINDGGKFEEAIKRFAKGIMALPAGPLFNSSLDTMTRKMAIRVPQLAEKVGATEMQLTHAVKTEMAQIMAKDPLFNDSHRQNIISTLSGVDKFANASARRARAK